MMIVYQLVKWWARITMFFFFRRIRVTGKASIPHDASVIFAPNHQSAFLDPILVAVNTRKSPWFLTRASVFKGPLVSSLLRVLHMIPVFRPRDLVDLKTANNQTFDFCHELLLGGGSILIFPEGNHGMQKRLRIPLKKGIGRIALRAAKAMHDGQGREVVIIPVGINYEHPTRFRTDLLLNFGKPISLNTLTAGGEKQESANLNELREQLAKGLQDQMIDIRPKERYDELEYAWQTRRTMYSDLQKRFEADKALIASLSASDEVKPQPAESSGRSVWNMLLLVAGFPFWLLGVVLNLGWILAVKLILRYLVADPHFIHSVKFLSVMVGLPLFSWASACILSSFTGGFWYLLVLIPLSGLLAYEYQDRIWRRPGLVLVKDQAGDSLPED